jgi:hypothetical protein
VKAYIYIRKNSLNDTPLKRGNEAKSKKTQKAGGIWG